MLVFLEGKSTPVDTCQLKKLGGGEDGSLYELHDQVLKMLKSGYMTEEKIRDLRNAIPNSEEIRIVPPLLIASNSNQKKPVYQLNPAFGYTERFIKENPSFILSFDKSKFFEEMHLLRKQVHTHLSQNNIGLMDTNPNNILVSQTNNGLYLIDHDRDVTPNSMYAERARVRSNDYFAHNDRKLQLLMYKTLLLQLMKYNGIQNTRSSDPVLLFVDSECQRTDISYKTIENTLEQYQTLSEYTEDTIKKIKKRK